MPPKNSGCHPLIIKLLLTLLAGIAFIVLVVYISDTPYWKWLLLLFPVIFITAWLYDAKEKKEKTQKAMVCLEAGKLIFPTHQQEFTAYFQSSRHAKKKKKEPIDILCEFAHTKGLTHVIDWRGEDEEGEIEEFIENLLGQKIPWPHTSTLRNTSPSDDQRDGDFIEHLFKAVDKDLKAIGKKLIFLGQGDTYEYTIIDTKTFTAIKKLKLDGLRDSATQ